MYTNSSRSYLKMASGTPRRTNGTPWRTGGTPTAEYSFAAIRIIPNADDSEMREMLKDSSVRNDILSGIGVSGAIYVGVGGGIMIPSSSEYVNRIKIYVVGVGTPQIGFGIGLAQSMKEKEERMRSEISDGTIIE